LRYRVAGSEYACSDPRVFRRAGETGLANCWHVCGIAGCVVGGSPVGSPGFAGSAGGTDGPAARTTDAASPRGRASGTARAAAHGADERAHDTRGSAPVEAGHSSARPGGVPRPARRGKIVRSAPAAGQAPAFGAWSRRMRFRILPVALLGSSRTNSTLSGAL